MSADDEVRYLRRVPESAESSVTLSVEQATSLARGVLLRLGFTSGEASTIARQLVDAELVGTSIMGLIRLKLIADLAARGDRRPISVSVDQPGYTLLDGGGNPGYLSVERAVDVAIDKATVHSLAFVGVKNSPLAGMAGFYVDRLARAGLVGAMLISSYARVAPYGGVDPVLGTNPLAFGFPAEGDPIVVDVSTSVISNGQVEMARTLGLELPPGAAVDAHGNETQDPSQAQLGALLPAAAHKGFGLALAVQIFGLMVGGDPVPAGLGNQGIVLIAVDPEAFGSRETFQAGVTELLAAVKGSRHAPGAEEIRYPGEGRARTRRARLESGIVVPRGVLTLIEGLTDDRSLD